MDAEQADPHSFLWFQKRLIALRKQSLVFGRGTLEFLNPDNRRVIAFIREYEGERVLVVANLSRFVQHAELDLSRFAGQMPVELFSRNEFPRRGPPARTRSCSARTTSTGSSSRRPGQPASTSAPSRLPELPNVRSVDTPAPAARRSRP